MKKIDFKVENQNWTKAVRNIRIDGISFEKEVGDYIENIFSFLVLYNPDGYAEFYVPMISLFASIKFILLLVSLILSLVHAIKKFNK